MATIEDPPEQDDGAETPYEGWNPWRATELYRKWYNKTQRGDPNDFVVAVSAASTTGVSGTGKTTLLSTLAKEFDATESGFDAEKKSTLDITELAYERLPDIESNSAVVADEIQGNVGSEGLDARRSMKQSSIDAINSITANRNKQLTVLLGAQILKMLDKRIYPLIDAWLLIREEPSSPRGPLAAHYELYTDDLNLSSQQWKTPRMETLTWPQVPHDDPDYQHLEQLKEQAKRKSSEPEDSESGELPKHIRDQEIREFAELGIKQEMLAKKYDLTQSAISLIVNDK